MSRGILSKLSAAMLLLLLISCNDKQSTKLTIAVAANMRFAIEDLASAFSRQTAIECDLIISSSGTLTAQILEGAPYDVFVAANTDYPAKVFESGFSTGAPMIYASGTLVLWTINNELPGINALAGNDIRHIAIANPKLAPYGLAAIQFLERQGLYNAVKDKLVFGESLSQTNQFIMSKAADVGITSLSTVLSPGMEDKGIWLEIDPSAYEPIDQAMVIVKRSSSEALQIQAQQFYDFLFSVEAKKILTDYGYKVN